MKNIVDGLRKISNELEKEGITGGFRIGPYSGNITVGNINKDTYSIIEKIFKNNNIDICITGNSSKVGYKDISFEILNKD